MAEQKISQYIKRGINFRCHPPITGLKAYKNIPRKIYITKGVHKKTKIINKVYMDWLKEINSEEFGIPIIPQEWYSITLARRNDEKFIHRDALLVFDQSNSEAETNARGIGLTLHEMEEIAEERGEDYFNIGWLHSHGRYINIHSQKDDKATEEMLETIAMEVEEITKGKFNEWREYKLFEEEPVLKNKEGYAFLRSKNRGDPLIQMKIQGELKSIDEFKVLEPVAVGFCTSIVVNNSSQKPYGVIAIQEEGLISNNKKNKLYKAEVEIVEVDDDIKIDSKQIKYEVKNRISLDKPYNWVIEEREFGNCQRLNKKYFPL